MNIDSVSINARSIDGEALEMRKHNNSIKIDITSEPYIEIMYKGVFYAIELTSTQKNYALVMKMIEGPTMKLIEYNEI